MVCVPMRAGGRLSHATSFAPSTNATARSVRPEPLDRGLRGGYAREHRNPPPEEFHVVESWSGYEPRTRRVGLGRDAAALKQTARS